MLRLERGLAFCIIKLVIIGKPNEYVIRIENNHFMGIPFSNQRGKDA